jgi:hypothetical protein
MSVLGYLIVRLRHIVGMIQYVIIGYRFPDVIITRTLPLVFGILGRVRYQPYYQVSFSLRPLLLLL